MSTLIVYYSFSGNAKRLAGSLAAQLPADLIELRDAKKIGKLKAYTAGIVKSIGGKAWPVQPLDVDFALYSRVMLIAPVWAGNVPPAVNHLWDLLPAGTALEVTLVSGSGKSECRARLEKTLQERGCVLVSLEDIKM